jgi:putative heme-binding domain-containing protein
MYGALYVVHDVEAFTQDPQSYISRHGLIVHDELLKSIGQSREWKYEELLPAMASLHEGRSFDVGKQLFVASTCESCHRMSSNGQRIGPDLTKLDEKVTAHDILKSMVTPSDKIDDKFRSYAFALSSGRTVTGLVVKETAGAYEILTDPAAPDKLTVVAKDDVEERLVSPKSIMPEGLLSKLKEDDILDLVAYILSRGDAQHSLYAHQHAPQ